MDPQHSSVWYATRKKIKSPTKMVVFSDRGALQISDDGLSFQGKKYTVSPKKVVSVALVRQTIPWVSYLIVNAVVIAYLVGMYGRRMDPALLIGIMVGANFFGLAVGLLSKWIRVSYLDESGQTDEAYFADGSMLGWGGVFGGTRTLYQAIAPIEKSRETK